MIQTKVALIGAGQVSMPYFTYLQKNRNVRLVAVCDLNKGRAAILAKRFRVNNVYDDATEMLKKEKPEVLFILSSPTSHATLAIQSMKAGAHVFIEKPMALSVKECDEIINAAKSTGRTVGVNHNRLFLRTVKSARAMLARGELGNLTGVEIRFIQRARELDDENHWAHKFKGGAFTENLPHALYLARAFLGEVEPVAASFRKQCNRAGMRNDELRVILNGVKASGVIIHSFNAPRDFEMIDIYGTKANLHLVMDSIFIKYGTAASSRSSYVIDYLSQAAQITMATIQTSVHGLLGIDRSFGRWECIQGFLNALEEKGSPPVTAEDGKAQALLLERILSLAIQK